MNYLGGGAEEANRGSGLYRMQLKDSTGRFRKKTSDQIHHLHTTHFVVSVIPLLHRLGYKYQEQIGAAPF